MVAASARRGRRPGSFLFPDEKEQVEAAIAAAEARTSAELRVLIARKAGSDALAAARDAFRRLGMHETAERNGVLIYLAVASRAFAIFGDEAIDRVVTSDGWQHIRDAMSERFRAGAFGAGLVEGVEAVGEFLATSFPCRPGDRNELPNDVVEE